MEAFTRRWQVTHKVAGGTVVIDCVLHPQFAELGTLQGTVGDGKETGVTQVAKSIVSKMEPKPGERFLYSFPNEQATRLPPR
jgi:hypothetical protein